MLRRGLGDSGWGGVGAPEFSDPGVCGLRHIRLRSTWDTPARTWPPQWTARPHEGRKQQRGCAPTSRGTTTKPSQARVKGSAGHPRSPSHAPLQQANPDTDGSSSWGGM